MYCNCCLVMGTPRTAADSIQQLTKAVSNLISKREWRIHKDDTSTSTIDRDDGIRTISLWALFCGDATHHVTLNNNTLHQRNDFMNQLIDISMKAIQRPRENWTNMDSKEKQILKLIGHLIFFSRWEKLSFLFTETWLPGREISQIYNFEFCLKNHSGNNHAHVIEYGLSDVFYINYYRFHGNWKLVCISLIFALRLAGRIISSQAVVWSMDVHSPTKRWMLTSVWKKTKCLPGKVYHVMF